MSGVNDVEAVRLRLTPSGPGSRAALVKYVEDVIAANAVPARHVSRVALAEAIVTSVLHRLGAGFSAAAGQTAAVVESWREGGPVRLAPVRLGEVVGHPSYPWLRWGRIVAVMDPARYAGAERIGVRLFADEVERWPSGPVRRVGWVRVWEPARRGCSGDV